MARRVVWKYAILDGEGEFAHDVPSGAEFAHLGVQDDEPFLWFVVDPARDVERVRFYARDTGQPLDEADGVPLARLVFLGTYETDLRFLKARNVRHVWRDAL